MKRLYLETNYLVGQAFSQDPLGATILHEAASFGAEVCLPSICVQEALATVEVRAKQTSEFSRTLQGKMRDLRSDQSATAQVILSLLNQVLIENGRLANERQLRLASVFNAVSNVHFVHIDSQVTSQAVTSPIIVDGATDNLILHAVVMDAMQSPADDMAFFTYNSRDFGESAVVAALTEVKVVPMFSSGHVIAWLKTP